MDIASFKWNTFEKNIAAHDAHTVSLMSQRFYLTSDDRQAFIHAASSVSRKVRMFCTVPHDTDGRVSEALLELKPRVNEHYYFTFPG